MAYAAWSVVFGEQPSATKWNILGTNDAHFADYIDRSGFPVQIKATAFSAVATGTTIIPLDDTIPQITEGDQYMTQAITPTSTTNILIIEADVFMSNSAGASSVQAALFQDATASALAASAHRYENSLTIQPVKLTHVMTAGTTSSTTFRIRAGGSLAGTTTFNGSSGARLYGAITKSSLRVTEIKL